MSLVCGLFFGEQEKVGEGGREGGGALKCPPDSGAAAPTSFSEKKSGSAEKDRNFGKDARGFSYW